MASLQCCRASRNGVVWPVAVLAAVYLVLGLTGLAIVIDAADSFTQCAADGIILAPAALEVTHTRPLPLVVKPLPCERSSGGNRQRECVSKEHGNCPRICMDSRASAESPS